MPFVSQLGVGLVALAFALPAQTLLVLNKAEASASLIDPATGTVRTTTPIGDGPHEVAVSPDGKTAVACNYGEQIPGSTLSVLDVATGDLVKTIELRRPESDEARYHRPHGIVFLPDGKHVVVTAEVERKLLVVDVEQGTVARAISTKQGGSHMAALTPDGKRAFVANVFSGSVSVLDLAEGEHRATIPTGKGAEGIAVHPTRPECWVTNNAADTVSVIDTEQLEVVAEIACTGFPIRVAFTGDGRKALVSCAKSGVVKVFDVEDRQVLREVQLELGTNPVPVGLLVRPDGKSCYVACMQADTVLELDLETFETTRALRAGRGPDGMAWSTAGG